MLPDQPVDILAVRSRLAAKAGRVGGVLEREISAIEYLAAVKIGERHLGGWDEIEIPFARDLEEILLELGQLSGANQRLRVCQKRRLHLSITMLPGVQIQHEVDQRARQARPRSAQHGKPCAGDPGGALEIKNAERVTQGPVLLRLEIEPPRRSVPTDFHVVARVCPVRHARVQQVGQRQQRRGALMFDGIPLHRKALDIGRALLARLVKMRRVLTLALGSRNLFAGRILLLVQALELRNDLTPGGFERHDLFERLVRIGAAPAQPLPDLLEVIANIGRVEHVILGAIVRYDLRVATVRKAVFPAAGLGTRFLPATKAQPKEMLPLVDKPIIQYGVEEAVASGAGNIILVTGRGKNAIEDHFDVSVELESFLEARGKRDQLSEIRKISSLINVSYVRQGEPLGLGHAVLVTRELVGNEPFAVILADDVIDADPPATRQLIDVFDQLDGPVLAVERVPRDQISSYGVIAIEPNGSLGKGIHQVRDLVEKPPRDEAPSDLAIIGRYVLTPDLFPCLAATKSDRTGEIQLTNGLRELLRSRPIYACEVKGVRHDTGNKLGFLKAVVYFALRRPDLAGPFSEYLRREVASDEQRVTR